MSIADDIADVRAAILIGDVRNLAIAPCRRVLDHLDKLSHERDVLKEALEFYTKVDCDADGCVYHDHNVLQGQDISAKARAALASLAEKNKEETE